MQVYDSIWPQLRGFRFLGSLQFQRMARLQRLFVASSSSLSEPLSLMIRTRVSSRLLREWNMFEPVIISTMTHPTAQMSIFSEMLLFFRMTSGALFQLLPITRVDLISGIRLAAPNPPRMRLLPHIWMHVELMFLWQTPWLWMKFTVCNSWQVQILAFCRIRAPYMQITYFSVLVHSRALSSCSQGIGSLLVKVSILLWLLVQECSFVWAVSFFQMVLYLRDFQLKFYVRTFASFLFVATVLSLYRSFRSSFRNVGSITERQVWGQLYFLEEANQSLDRFNFIEFSRICITLSLCLLFCLILLASMHLLAQIDSFGRVVCNSIVGNTTSSAFFILPVDNLLFFVGFQQNRLKFVGII